MAELPSIAAAEPSGEALGAEQLQFKKRARRRLVGAIALTLLAVIVLPMVMDQEPKPLNQDIQIRIPSQEASVVSSLARTVTGKPLPTPLPALPKATETSPAAASAAAVPAAKPVPAADSPKAGATAASSGKPGETKSAAPAAKSPPPERGVAMQWEVQLGAYKNQTNVSALQSRLKGLGLPSFTEKIETSQGPRTRVRGGPFSSRAAAEKAQAQLKKLSIGAPAGGVVAQKP